MGTRDSVERLQLLGQLDLGAAVEVMTGSDLWSIQQQIATACSVYRARVAVPSSNASGKFVRASEPVLTPTGWVPISELYVGDEVIAGDGTVTVVTGVFPQGKQQLYRFHLDNGITVDSGAPHLWAVDAYEYSSLAGYTKQRTVLSTQDIIARYGGEGVLPNTSKRVALPMVGPVQFPAKEVPLDPYLLGLLIGDGEMTSSVCFSTADIELLNAFTTAGLGARKRSSKYDYGISGVQGILKDLGLHGKKSVDKFIPDCYVWNTPEVRLAVLQGLMDTDGGISGAGSEFSTSSETLAYQVQFLVQSLGGRASIRKRETNCLPNYRLNITVPMCPYRLARKAEAWEVIDSTRKETKAYTIQKVTRVDIDDAVCISVAHPDSLYVISNCIVTHNTFLAARLALAFYMAYTPGAPCIQCDPWGIKGGCRGSKVITTSSKEEHLRDNMWGELRAAHSKIRDRGIVLPGKLYEGDLRLVDNESNHYIIGQSAATAEGLQGAHAAHKLIIGDEATSVDTEVQLAITRLLASSDSRILLIYNPTTPDTYASKMARSPAFTRIKITAWDTPNLSGEGAPEGSNLITQAFLDELVAQGMGPGTFEWVTSIEAEDWDQGEDNLIPSGMYIARNRNDYISGDGIRQIGVDIASYGTDENTIAVREGGNLIDLISLPSMMTEQYVRGPVLSAVTKYRPHVVVFDADGVGAGAVGYFDELKPFLAPGGRVIGFRGGKGVEGRYMNARSQWYWELRRKFETGYINNFVHDTTLEKQATNIRYTVTANGDVRVEPKQEMRKRGVGSPDRADAVMYAFAFDGRFKHKVQEATPVTLEDVARANIMRLKNKRHQRVINPVLGVPY